MKTKAPKLTPQQKAQTLGDNPPSLATAIKKLPLRDLPPDSPSKQSALNLISAIEVWGYAHHACYIIG
jgi:hypothetical protein